MDCLFLLANVICNSDGFINHVTLDDNCSKIKKKQNKKNQKKTVTLVRKISTIRFIVYL